MARIGQGKRGHLFASGAVVKATQWPCGTAQRGLSSLDRLNWNCRHIFDQPHFLLQKWLPVSHAGQHAVEARHGLNTRAYFISGRKDVFAGLLVVALIAAILFLAA